LSYLSIRCSSPVSSTPLFFYTATASSEIYTLSLHDALPILKFTGSLADGTHTFHNDFGDITVALPADARFRRQRHGDVAEVVVRSEEHTSELQSRFDLVCRLLLEKKKRKRSKQTLTHSKTTH